MFKIVSLIIFLFFFSGCSMREYTLFQDSNESGSISKISDEKYSQQMIMENKIAVNDIISVNVLNYNTTSRSDMISTMNPTPSDSYKTSSNVTLNDSENGRKMLIDKSGIIRLPLVGEVKVAGLTESEASQYITKMYERYIKNPYVLVKITNQRVIVLGEVGLPGIVSFETGEINLIEVIARSGDFTDYAERTKIKIIRGDLRNPDIQTVDLTQLSMMRYSNLYLRSNDIVYIEPRAIKGVNMGLQQAGPPFQFITTLLMPYVTIKYLTD